MKNILRIVGVSVALISAIMIGLMYSNPSPTLETPILITLFGFLLTLALPGLIIDMILTIIGVGIEDNDSMQCGGIPSGGYLIGYTERSLIFLSFLINFYDSTLSYASILSFLSVIVAGKAIFRYSSKNTDDRSCADWYILGTLMSITMALALSWGLFRFLLVT
ncbi:MAG: hypothetical protein RTV72_10800 [Candidatus Thorarchaeota archaeon]